MSHLNKILFITICITLIFCISCRRAGRVPAMPKKPVQSLQIIRGETAMDPPDKVWKQYNCKAKQLPFVIIESDYLNASVVTPGQQLGHNIVYAMCSKNNKPIQGDIQRKIYYGDTLLSKKSKEFELRPGRWSVGSIIEAPEKAKPGVYELKTEFNSRVYKNELSAKQFSIQK